MAVLTFKRAAKEQARLRLALFGPSGSGKTYTALRMATGIGGRIAVIDTERGSASKYADRFTFDVLELPRFDIDTYCEGIKAASGYGVLIIDSLTHGWRQLVEEMDRLANAKYKGNTWSAWAEGTPMQRSLVDALVSFDGHIIATMRTKTEWALEKDEKGRNKPTRVGLAPEQGKGIEYEFDVLMEISPEHYGHIIKDRTGKYQDAYIDKPGEDFGGELAAWLSDGAPRVERPVVTEAKEERNPFPPKPQPTPEPARQTTPPPKPQSPPAFGPFWREANKINVTSRSAQVLFGTENMGEYSKCHTQAHLDATLALLHFAAEMDMNPTALCEALQVQSLAKWVDDDPAEAVEIAKNTVNQAIGAMPQPERAALV